MKILVNVDPTARISTTLLSWTKIQHNWKVQIFETKFLASLARTVFCLETCFEFFFSVFFSWVVSKTNYFQYLRFAIWFESPISKNPVSIDRLQLNRQVNLICFSDTDCIVRKQRAAKPKSLKNKATSPPAARTNRSAELRRKANEAKLSKFKCFDI